MPKDQAQHYELIGVKGVIGLFFQKLEQLDGRSWLDKLVSRFQSDQDTETYGSLGTAPALREWLGGKQLKSFADLSMRITNKDWESTIRVKNKDRRRDKTGQLEIQIAGLAERARAHDAKMISSLLDVGDGTTLATAFDGKALFADDHSVGASGTIDNKIDVDISALPVGEAGSHGTTTAPSIGEMALAIQQGITTLYTFKDDQGEPLNELAQEFLVMVPTGLAAVADAAMQSTYISAGMTNPVLFAGAPAGGLIRRAVWQNPRLTWTTKFAVFRTDGVVKPFIIQEEFGPMMKALAEGSDNEFFNNEALFSVEKSGNVGLGRFDQAVQVTLI